MRIGTFVLPVLHSPALSHSPKEIAVLGVGTRVDVVDAGSSFGRQGLTWLLACADTRYLLGRGRVGKSCRKMPPCARALTQV